MKIITREEGEKRFESQEERSWKLIFNFVLNLLQQFLL